MNGRQLTRRMLEGSLSISFVAFSSPLRADPAYTTPSTVQSINIREYQINVYLPLAGNPMNCASRGWFRLQMSSSNYNAIASYVITEVAQHGSMRVYTNACDSDGGVAVCCGRVWLEGICCASP